MKVDLTVIEQEAAVAARLNEPSSLVAQQVLDAHIERVFVCRLCGSKAHSAKYDSNGIMGPAGASKAVHWQCGSCSVMFMDPWKWSGKVRQDEEHALRVALVELALVEGWLTPDEAAVYPQLTFNALVWSLAEACAAKGGDLGEIINITRIA